MSSTISTHVLDTARGRPGDGIAVRLERETDPPETVASGQTDRDGRLGDLGPDNLAVGSYRLVLETSEYFARTGTTTFFPRVEVVFSVAHSDEHYHVPVLVSPFSFSTYRGS